MPDPLRQESPLVGAIKPSRERDAQPILAERPLRGFVNLRADPSSETVVAAIVAALGVAPPRVNAFACKDDRYVIRLGPDELLISVPPGEQGTVEAWLAQGLAGQNHALTDVSSGYTMLRISGGGARELIATGCPLDLHPRSLPRGACAGTHIAKAEIVILHGEADGEFQLIVRRSFAGYLWRWLADACDNDEYNGEIALTPLAGRGSG